MTGRFGADGRRIAARERPHRGQILAVESSHMTSPPQPGRAGRADSEPKSHTSLPLTEPAIEAELLEPRVMFSAGVWDGDCDFGADVAPFWEVGADPQSLFAPLRSTIDGRAALAQPWITPPGLGDVLASDRLSYIGPNDLSAGFPPPALIARDYRPHPVVAYASPVALGSGSSTGPGVVFEPCVFGDSVASDSLSTDASPTVLENDPLLASPSVSLAGRTRIALLQEGGETAPPVIEDPATPEIGPYVEPPAALPVPPPIAPHAPEPPRIPEPLRPSGAPRRDPQPAAQPPAAQPPVAPPAQSPSVAPAQQPMTRRQEHSPPAPVTGPEPDPIVRQPMGESFGPALDPPSEAEAQIQESVPPDPDPVEQPPSPEQTPPSDPPNDPLQGEQPPSVDPPVETNPPGDPIPPVDPRPAPPTDVEANDPPPLESLLTPENASPMRTGDAGPLPTRRSEGPDRAVAPSQPEFQRAPYGEQPKPGTLPSGLDRLSLTGPIRSEAPPAPLQIAGPAGEPDPAATEPSQPAPSDEPPAAPPRTTEPIPEPAGPDATLPPNDGAPPIEIPEPGSRLAGDPSVAEQAAGDAYLQALRSMRARMQAQRDQGNWMMSGRLDGRQRGDRLLRSLVSQVAQPTRG